jgi:hypothetical protein
VLACAAAATLLTPLLVLDLQGNNLKDPALCDRIVKMITRSRTLREVCLQGNAISSEASSRIIRAVEVCFCA